MSLSSSINVSDSNSLSAQAPKSKHLSMSQKIIYVLPAIGVGFFLNLVGIAQGIYAKYFGLVLTSIVTIVLVARLFDVVTDLLIECFSDRKFAQAGSRRPFFLWGSLLLLVSGYFLFIPLTPAQLEASPDMSVAYFLCWWLLFYLAFTDFWIPHQSWGAGLTSTAEATNSMLVISNDRVGMVSRQKISLASDVPPLVLLNSKMTYL